MEWQRIREKIGAIPIGDIIRKIQETTRRFPILTYLSLMVLVWMISIAIVIFCESRRCEVTHFLALLNGMIDGLIVGGALSFVFAKFFENFTRYAIGVVGAGGSYGAYVNWDAIQAKLDEGGLTGLVPSFSSVFFGEVVKMGTDLGMETYWTKVNVETFWLTFFALIMITFVGRFIYLTTQFKRPDPKKSSLWANRKIVPIEKPLSVIINIRNCVGNPIPGIKARLHCDRGEDEISPDVSFTDVKGEVEFKVSGTREGKSVYKARADDIDIAGSLEIEYGLT